MKMIITQREAQDDYHAQMIAQGMENAGAEVFSITKDLRGNIQVYCRHPKSLSEDKIDKKINAEVCARAICYAAA